MKQKKNYYFLCIVASLLFSACNKAELTKDQEMKIAFYDKYFSEGDSLIGKSRFNQLVKADSADLCIANYESFKLKLDTNQLKTMLRTTDVGFNFIELKYWLNDTLKGVQVDEIRIYFGAYTKEYSETYLDSNTSLVNRLSVFLWPYYKGKRAVKVKNDASKNDELVDPYNIGNIHPNP